MHKKLIDIIDQQEQELIDDIGREVEQEQNLFEAMFRAIPVTAQSNNNRPAAGHNRHRKFFSRPLSQKGAYCTLAENQRWPAGSICRN